MSQTPNRRNRPVSRVVLRRQIVALAGFAICIVTLLVAGPRIVDTSVGPSSPGTGSATSTPASPGDGGGGNVYVAPEGTAQESTTTPTTAANVLTLVIAGVSGTGGFLSGVAALLTVRQSARQARRQQNGPSDPVPAAAGDVTGVS
ncbi:hypothetical protein ACGFZB_33145 [Streptomyces cinerochromogenes]|uniref:Tat pathway signal sequence domain protein n=1 Tax=Streptomyces cinerochromogenes TaxID=66422 RepID=A0ABW7BDD0_9ACTN